MTNRILISLTVIALLAGGAAALDAKPVVEPLPGETTAEMLFNRGIGEPWVGGNPPDSLFSQYYSMYRGSAPVKHIGVPKKGDINGKTPTVVYFGYQMLEMPYTQFQTYASSTGSNLLFIQGPSSWTQYAKVPQGSLVSVIASSSAGGNGYLYEINPDGTLNMNPFYFYPGYNQIDFYADLMGKHMMLFEINGQVSNVAVIDVMSSNPPVYQQPAPSYPPAQIQPPSSSPFPTYGDTPVTIVSQGMRGYQVFLDGNLIGIEGTGGDTLDGRFSFSVVGNQNHEVRVYDGQFNYPKTMYFQRGVQKIINVEPGTAVYI